MKKKLLQIAIDGPAGSGKTTVSRLLSNHYSIYYLSSGKIFRSYALALKDVDVKNKDVVKNELKQFELTFSDGKFFINALDVTNNITADILSLPASTISAYPFTRKKYLKDIKKICKSNPIVIDGRDIGTVVMPHAPFKFYLDASPEIRAKRRAAELHAQTNANSPEFKKILEDILLRDSQDKNRKIAPLKKAKDAIYINSDELTADEVVAEMIKVIDAKRGNL